MGRAVDDLTQELGRSPRTAEIATRTGLPEDRVRQALDVRGPLSLDFPPEGGLSMEPSEDDSWTERLQDRALLASLLAPLNERHRLVIELYYGEGLSQRAVATRLGVSQMCISRRLRKALQEMRTRALAQ